MSGLISTVCHVSKYFWIFSSSSFSGHRANTSVSRTQHGSAITALHLNWLRLCVFDPSCTIQMICMPTHRSQVRPGRVCWRCRRRCSAANWGCPRDPNCSGRPGESAWRRCKPPSSAASLDLSGLEIQTFFVTFTVFSIWNHWIKSD